MAAVALIALAAALAGAPPAATKGVELAWTQAGEAAGEGEVRVLGLPPAALSRVGRGEMDPAVGERLLRVVVAPPLTSDEQQLAVLPNVWGAWAVRDGALAFRPRHAVAPGATLRAHFDGAAFDDLTGGRDTPSLDLRVDVPAGASATVVVGASPAGDEVPENLLRLYVEFSAPMSMRGIERHVRLLDAAGRDIPEAFVEVPDGLWDPERRRLTLLLHPGRVKSGLEMGDRLGPVLVRGATVTLVVDAEARDADGRPLARGFNRSWRVGPPRRAALDPGAWLVEPPATPRASVTVELPWALDRAIVARAITVLDPAGSPVPARMELAGEDRFLRFWARDGWRAGETYRLRVEPFLEDPSGNRPGRPFEREPREHAPARPSEIEFVAGGLSSSGA